MTEAIFRKRTLLFLFLLSIILNVNAQEKEKFYSDGYYFSQQEIKIKNWKFSWLSIFIKPSENNKPYVSLRLLDSQSGKFINIGSHKYSITKDNTAILFSSKLVGEISITGRYTISKPPFDNKEIKENTIVFIGDLSIDKSVYPIKFTWSEGD